MTHNICTLSDYAYLTRVILLYESICRYEPGAKVYFLALDDETYKVMRAIGRDNLVVLHLDELETPELTAARNGRNWVEWVWLFQPVLPLHLMENCDVDHIFWMDGDMWLFDDLREMFDEIGDADVAVSPHRFPPHRPSAATVSIYNGGATYFRNTERGRACCRRWVADCIEWDYWWSAAKPGPKRGQKGGTQGYLDFWPDEWDAHIVQHLGCNLAPWNQDHPGYLYQVNDEGEITINGQKLLFYHFQDFKPEQGFIAGPQIVKFVVDHIYGPYVTEYQLKKRLWQPAQLARDIARQAT